ncbi:MAG: hypothetical protein HYX92_05750 [Chloroflexi bacterium]|nr:hypothetical protein [Chloroflexota bacterium]
MSGGGRNYEGVSDSRIDALYHEAARTLDMEQRKKMFWEAERILREDIVPVAPLFWPSKYSGYWQEVKGYAGIGLGYFEGHSMEEVWLDK